MEVAEPPVRLAIVGLGKMGLSHFAIANGLAGFDVVAVCDQSAYVLDVLKRYTGVTGYTSFDVMVRDERLDAVLIATPSSSHASLVKAAIEHDLHVFCEKPFTLSADDANGLVTLAQCSRVVTQVGYHYRFVGSFQEAKRLVANGALGEISHILGEAYGPVVLRAKGGTWRGKADEGGGALYDYAAHVVDLICWLAGSPVAAGGTSLGRIFSSEIEDQVASTLYFEAGRSAQISVNWSDEAYRKMSTSLTVRGTTGTLYANRQECRVFLRSAAAPLDGYDSGWNVKYTTELTSPVGFYLRGEEYTAQLEYFARSVVDGRRDGENTFASASVTDTSLALIAGDADAGHTAHLARPALPSKRHRRPLRRIRPWKGRS